MVVRFFGDNVMKNPSSPTNSFKEKIKEGMEDASRKRHTGEDVIEPTPCIEREIAKKRREDVGGSNHETLNVKTCWHLDFN